MDMLADFLTIIRNGVMASRPFVFAPYSKERAAVGAILKAEGLVGDVSTVHDAGKTMLKIMLKFVDGESVIHEITRVSKPSRRVYTGAHAIRPVIGGLGLSILSTNKGIISHKKAKELNVGGEVICTVW
jgi:small subunit ribosomal protein S8